MCRLSRLLRLLAAKRQPDDAAICSRETCTQDIRPGKGHGQAIYAADIKLPHMLHGKILRSPYPHARILSIDASEALKIPEWKAL